MEKPVFSTKISYLPPPRNGRELIIRKSTIIYGTLFSFRCMKHLTANSIAALTHFSVAITRTAVRATAADHFTKLTHLPISPSAFSY